MNGGERRDQGFSMVELIVVIAIMAILVGVLAPAYLKYVEKSRKSADVQAIAQIMEAAEATATDEEFHVPAGAVFQIVATSGEVDQNIINWDDDDENAHGYQGIAQAEWREASNKGEPYSLKAKEFKAVNGEIDGLYDKTGLLKWTKGASDVLFGNMMEYSVDFGKKFSK